MKWYQEPTSGFLLHDDDLVLGSDVRPSHPDHVRSPLSRVQKQFERGTLLCAKGPPVTVALDFVVSPRANALYFRPSNAERRIVLEPTEIDRVPD